MSIGKAIKWILLLPVILIGIGIAYCEANKAYWDHRVRQLCEKDGGVTVFEHIELTREEYERNDGMNGTIRVMPERTSLDAHEYAWRNIDSVINDADPYVWRSDYVLYRKLDKRELAKQTTYSRRGGDFPLRLSHESSFGCSDMSGFVSDSLLQVFSVNGEKT